MYGYMRNNYLIQTIKSCTSGTALIIIKIALLIISLNTFEPISNLFKPGKFRKKYSTHEFLFFSNIGTIYSAFAVFLGFLKQIYPQITPIYQFVLPTALTLEMVVFLIFWTLFILKRDLVIRTNLNSGIWPYIYESQKHLCPLIMLFIEKGSQVLAKSNYQRIFLLLFAIAYFLILEWLIIYERSYVYPFLENMNLKFRALLFSGIFIASFFIYEFFLF